MSSNIAFAFAFTLQNILKLPICGNLFKITKYLGIPEDPRSSPKPTLSSMYQQFQYRYYVWMPENMPLGSSSCWRFWPLLIQACAIFTTNLSKVTPCHTTVSQGTFWNSSQGITSNLSDSQRANPLLSAFRFIFL